MTRAVFDVQKYAVLLLICLVAAGCSSTADKPSPTGENMAEVKNSLVLAVGPEPEEGFDPTAGWGRYGSPLFQSTLLKRNNELAITGDLALGYEVSADGKHWTVKLREDARFSDGEAVTAEDVKFTFETAAGGGSVIDLTNMASVSAPDKFTVEFELKEPQSTFVSQLVATGIVPQHAYSAGYANKPVGSGPYVLVQWDKGQQVIAEANPYYYGDKPRFKKLALLFLSEDAAFAAAKAGEVDIAYIPATFSTQQVPGMRLETARTVDNRGIAFPYVKAGEQTAEGYPVGNDVTADIAIRKAINIAVDRKALVEGVLEGHGTPAYTIVDGLPWWNESSRFADGNLEDARAILGQGGWSDQDGDGIVEKDGLSASFHLLYPANDVIRQSLAIAVADRVKSIGIEIIVEGKSWSDIDRLKHAHAVVWGWGSQDPMEMYNVYSSKYRGAGYYNTNYYSNAAVDEWMDKALRAGSEQEAAGYWKKAQWDGKTGLSMAGDAPWAWLVNIDHLYLVKEQLHIGKQRIHPHGHGWPVTDNIEEWDWMP